MNSSQSSRSVNAGSVVSPVEGLAIWDKAEGEAESAGGKKTCQKEIAVGGGGDMIHKYTSPSICSFVRNAGTYRYREPRP